MAHTAAGMEIPPRPDRDALHDAPWYIGGSAIVAAIAAAVGVLSFAAFLAIGPPFQTMADLSGVLLGLALVPLARGLNALYRRTARWQSLAVFAVALVAGALVAGSSLVLAFQGAGLGVKPTTWYTVGSVGSGIIGVWLLGVSWLDWSAGVLGRRISGVGAVAGVGYVLLAVGFLGFSDTHPLTAVGGLIGVVAFAGWAGWLGRRALR